MMPKSYPKFGAALCAIALSPSLSAFDWEATLGIDDSEGNAPERYAIELTRFLDPVNHSTTQPYLETAFLKRIGKLSIGLLRIDEHRQFSQEITPPRPGLPGFPITSTIDSRFRLDDWALEADYRRPGSVHAFQFQYNHIDNRNIQRTSTNNGPVRERSSSASGHILNLGYTRYLTDAWTVGAAASWGETDSEGSSAYLEIKSRDRGIALNTRRLWSIGNDAWFAIEASAAFNHTESRIDDLNFPDDYSLDHDRYTYDVSGTYYFDARTAVGASYRLLDQSSFDHSEIGLNFSRFLTDSLFLEVRFDVSDPFDRAYKRYGLSLGKRF